MSLMIIQMLIDHICCGIETALIQLKRRLLRDISHPQLSALNQLPVFRLFESCKDPQQRRFARAIGANQPDALPFLKSKCDPAEQLPGTVGLGKMATGEKHWEFAIVDFRFAIGIQCIAIANRKSQIPSRQLLFSILVLQKLIRRDHGDAIPGADLVAEGAADTTGKIDGADLKGQLVPRAWDDADAVDRADRHAGFAAGAHVFIKQRQNLGELLLGHYDLL